MADKVQKIREEVKKKLEVMQYQVHRKDAYKELKGVLAYIDSLQEEPVSENLEEVSDKIMPNKYCWSGDGETTLYTREQMKDYFKAGAQWQKEQMMKHCLEGRVVDDGGDFKLIVPSLHTILRNLDENDKVKVIIIKE